ncbi:MAG: hypothetical protein LC685_02970 [Actinobacteria bacterium]|nr:hypothetical protein [Actinomycetota bacterium]
MRPLIQHIPHAVPVVIIWGILIRYWLVQRRLEAGRPAAAPSSAAPAATPAPVVPVARTAPAPVRRSVALRGLAALGPLIGALGTGLVLYALNLSDGHAGPAAIWIHVGISLLALLLVVYKVSEIGAARLRAGITRDRALRSGGSIILLALWVPLLVSGVALVIAPSAASFTAYAHLIASVWWTGLLLWHLRRYLARAARTVLARPGVPATRPSAISTTSGRTPPRSRARGRRPGHPTPRAEAGAVAEDGERTPVHGR